MIIIIYSHHNDYAYYGIYRLQIKLVARWITDNYHLGSNLVMGIYVVCFIFDFASIPLGVARSI